MSSFLVTSWQRQRWRLPSSRWSTCRQSYAPHRARSWVGRGSVLASPAGIDGHPWFNMKHFSKKITSLIIQYPREKKWKQTVKVQLKHFPTQRQLLHNKKPSTVYEKALNKYMYINLPPPPKMVGEQEPPWRLMLQIILQVGWPEGRSWLTWRSCRWWGRPCSSSRLWRSLRVPQRWAHPWGQMAASWSGWQGAQPRPAQAWVGVHHSRQSYLYSTRHTQKEFLRMSCRMQRMETVVRKVMSYTLKPNPLLLQFIGNILFLIKMANADTHLWI